MAALKAKLRCCLQTSSYFVSLLFCHFCVLGLNSFYLSELIPWACFSKIKSINNESSWRFIFPFFHVTNAAFPFSPVKVLRLWKSVALKLPFIRLQSLPFSLFSFLASLSALAQTERWVVMSSVKL